MVVIETVDVVSAVENDVVTVAVKVMIDLVAIVVVVMAVVVMMATVDVVVIVMGPAGVTVIVDVVMMSETSLIRHGAEGCVDRSGTRGMRGFVFLIV